MPLKCLEYKGYGEAPGNFNLFHYLEGTVIVQAVGGRFPRP